MYGDQLLVLLPKKGIFQLVLPFASLSRRWLRSNLSGLPPPHTPLGALHAPAFGYIKIVRGLCTVRRTPAQEGGRAGLGLDFVVQQDNREIHE